MSTVRLSMMGGLGNRMHQFAHAKAFCEQNNHELRCEEWVGEKIFTLDGYVPKRPNGTEQIQLFGYFQTQKDLIYSRADCRRWFKIRPEVEQYLIRPIEYPHAHFRRGDYAGAGFPLISRASVDKAAAEHGIPLGPNGGSRYIAVSEEDPQRNHMIGDDMQMLPDFYKLMKAPVLFRANSTFSFWSGVLGNGRVFSPRIDGLTGGIEHDNVRYEEGNHCRCADLPFVTDLHLKE
jgi:hypothetical protein